MPDLLVRLYDLPEGNVRLPVGVTVRRALGPERQIVLDWIGRTFQTYWVGECAVAFSAQPIATWIATKANRVVGFACHDGTAKGFFGPTGVEEKERGHGIGEALLMATLRGMREAGYAYAVIGDAGPAKWYRKRLDCLSIPKSKPGVYKGLLPRD